MEKITKMRDHINELKTKAKAFNPNNCDGCKQKLQLPTIHFMCGHTFHDQCIDGEPGQRNCSTCMKEFADINEKKAQYNAQAKDPQQFYRDLNTNAKKFHIVAQYFGRGLFADLN